MSVPSPSRTASPARSPSPDDAVLTSRRSRTTGASVCAPP
jgi:hypothetical protein